MADPKVVTFAKDANGDLAIPIQLLTGRAAFAQRLQSRFRFFKNEWFLDKRKGADYYRLVLIKNPNLSLVRTLFRKIILSTPGAQTLTNFTLSLDNLTRTVSIDFELTLSDGSIFRTQSQEFIIRFPS